MNRSGGRRRVLRRSALLVVLASVAASAVIGCYVVIVGEFDDTEARLLGTSLSAFAASTIALVRGVSGSRRSRPMS